MGLLRLAVLGPPEVFHDGCRLNFSLRKAQALLLYLAVQGGMQPRSKLAALLWPDSDPHDARTALRNAYALLRTLLADTEASPGEQRHLLSASDLLGFNQQAPFELDLHLIQQAYTQAQRLPPLPSEEQRASLLPQWQHALAQVRGPFLDGFWLRKETPFDEWVRLQQHQWQVRLQLLFDRLSSWHEAALEHEQANAILTRWLALDPLQEEAYRRLMRLHLARGDPSAAWQVYATCQAHLAQELQVEPSPQTVALTKRIRTAESGRPASLPRPATTTAESQPAGELVTPLVGRGAALSQLIGSFQQAQQGQPQAVLLVGEAGSGKTRLVNEFVAWARAQGTDVLRGQAFEAGGRLPYQSLVEALRVRLEAENAPEDLLEDLWLAELGRLLPELRLRYSDLPVPSQEALTAKVQLFEAVARLLEALAQRAPLLLVVGDLHWADEASLDLLRYLARSWKGHGTSVLLLGTVRSEELAPKSQLSAQLADLGRDLPLTPVTLQLLSREEILQLLETLVGQEEPGTSWPGGQPEGGTAGSSSAEPWVQPPALEGALVALGEFLFTQTGGHPLLGQRASAQRLWQLAELGVRVGVHALEEAVRCGVLHEEDSEGDYPSSYHCAYNLIRDVAYTELGAARRQVLQQRALALLHTERVAEAELA
jgi:DNA-binding SARP family transcriptional activator